jgi:AAA+ superfamily predicted ATPase
VKGRSETQHATAQGSAPDPGAPDGTAPARRAPAGPAWFEFGRWTIIRRARHIGALANGAEVAEAERAELDGLVAEASANLEASLLKPGAFSTLVANAELDLDSAEVLAIVATAEFDKPCQQLVAQLHGSSTAVDRVTVGVLRELLGPHHRGPLCVAYDGALRRSAFVEIGTAGPWVDHTVVLHPGVVWALIGDGSRDPNVPDDATTFEHADTSGGDAADFVIVNGPDRMRRWQAAAQRTRAGRFLCADAPETEVAWAALVREATITGRGLIIEVGVGLPPPGRRWIDRARHLVWVLSATSGPPANELPERRWVDVLADDAAPTDDEWTALLGPEADRTHRLTMDQLHRVSRDHAAALGDVDAAVRRLSSGRLEKVTQRIRPTRTWADIVVSQDRMALLRSVGDRYRNSNTVYDEWGFSPAPSRGLVAMFSGPSGTGKTLAAEIIAHDLGLDVFKLDLSSVVSKFIGETEKNLEQVFDAASAGNTVLFFDEADSLFGKRSEVKDARDRYANIEVSYLLQRLETYNGLVVMATNFEKNIDDAFLRRIHVRVAFAMPESDEREAIWRQNLPPAAPVGDVDLRWLAERFELSGGSIRNAVVHAAFAAAQAGTAITMQLLVTAVADEFRKAGRLVNAKDFGSHFEVVAEQR